MFPTQNSFEKGRHRNNAQTRQGCTKKRIIPFLKRAIKALLEDVNYFWWKWT